MFFKKPVAIGLSPNTDANDVILAIKNIFTFWNYNALENVGKLEAWFSDYFKSKYAFAFNSGRASLLAILTAIDLKEGDEVLLQAFTCVAVPDAVIEAKGIPVYVDINNQLTLDTSDLEKKVTKNTKAIIIQHTFGIPADMDKIVEIAKRKKFLVIEDCAHVIGGKYKGRLLGTFGNAALFSFGRDKAFSSVFGGLAITNDKNLGEKIRKFSQQLEYPRLYWTFQQLLHPIILAAAIPLYDFLRLGKIIIVAAQKIKLLSIPVLSDEKEGKVNTSFIKKYPGVLAILTINQLQKIDKYNNHRIKLVKLYQKELSDTKYLGINNTYDICFLRYPILADKQKRIINDLRKKGIYLGNWYSNIIDPKGVNFKKINYNVGSCPKAEIMAQKIINLPTYQGVTIEAASRICTLIKEYD